MASGCRVVGDRQKTKQKKRSSEATEFGVGLWGKKGPTVERHVRLLLDHQNTHPPLRLRLRRERVARGGRRKKGGGEGRLGTAVAPWHLVTKATSIYRKFGVMVLTQTTSLTPPPSPIQWQHTQEKKKSACPLDDPLRVGDQESVGFY